MKAVSLINGSDRTVAVIKNLLPKPLAVSPDGETIALIAKSRGSDALFLISADGKHKDRTLEFGFSSMSSPCYSPDGKSIVVTARKDERNIVATALTHEVISPRDPATGQATGRRMHKPLTITKLLDAASVQIFQALVTNENLPEVDIELREPSHAGAEVVVHRIVLTNASISDVATGVDVHNQPAGGGPRGAGGVGYEQVSFTYQKIEIDDGGLTALDDWSVNPT